MALEKPGIFSFQNGGRRLFIREELERYLHDGGQRQEPKLAYTKRFSLRLDEASEYFSISQSTLKRLCRENKETFAVPAGNSYLIIRENMEKFLRKTERLEEL